ncbi:MAG TPA: TraB/GumN family protein [Cellvibrio sp.]|nr:TraB/GumN family protein [Cellvibrio sp.]
MLLTLLLTVSSAVRADLTEVRSGTAGSHDTVEEFLVEGEQPGPRLWKVSRDNHSLWILGVLSPLPKQMQWRSHQVEETLKQSQEFITPPYTALKMSFLNQLLLIPSLLTLENNSDGKLVDVVPPELYARWSVLKENYIGRDKGVEKKRPFFAAHALYEKAIDKSGLTSDGAMVWSVVEGIVKKNKIKKTSPGINSQIKQPRKAFGEFKQASIADLECFAKTLERLESDLDAMRARSRAWALGDIEALRRLPYPDHDKICSDTILNLSLFKEQGLGDVRAREKQLWLEAAESAIANNQSSFAILDMAELLKPDGYLAALQEKGYSLEAP